MLFFIFYVLSSLYSFGNWILIWFKEDFCHIIRTAFSYHKVFPMVNMKKERLFALSNGLESWGFPNTPSVSESCWQPSGSNLTRYFCNDQQLIGWCNWMEIVLYGVPKILRATFCIQMHTPLQHHSLTVLLFMVFDVVSCFIVQCDIKHGGLLGCVIWQRKFMESSLTKFTSWLFKIYY